MCLFISMYATHPYTPLERGNMRIFVHVSLKNVSLVLLLVVFVLPGCSLFKQKDLPNSDWQKEVLMAQDCGLEGLSCCKDRAQVCDGGLSCCTNPTGTGENFCSENCDEGTKGKFCRADGQCDQGLSCVSNICVECGIVGNPCCEKDKCKTGESNKSDHAECFDGLCQLCGAAENRACLGEKCLPYNLLNNSTCFSCGGYNQPCCQISTSTEHECDASLKLRCRLGFCNE